jgi:hypothetical protein
MVMVKVILFRLIESSLTMTSDGDDLISTDHGQ